MIKNEKCFILITGKDNSKFSSLYFDLKNNKFTEL